MLKKAAPVVLLTVLLLTLVAVASATEPLMISSRSVGEIKVNASVSFSNGKAKATGTVPIVPAGCTAKVTVELQRKSDNSWIKVTRTTGGRSAYATSTAKTGTEYRTYATCRLYDSTGELIDSVSQTSGSKPH